MQTVSSCVLFKGLVLRHVCCIDDCHLLCELEQHIKQSLQKRNNDMTWNNGLKTLGMVALCLSSLVVFSACFEGEEYNDEMSSTPEESSSTLGLIYVSGHFGNYYDCPEEAYRVGGDESPSAVASDAVAGDCAIGESCGGPLNCEGAQLTVRLTNTGDETATVIEVADLLLIDSEGFERASFTVLSVVGTSETFVGELDAGESVDLRIEYSGPYNLNELLEGSGNQNNGRLRLKMKAAGQDEETLDTPLLDELPSVAT